jgi:hypothetical protein
MEPIKFEELPPNFSIYGFSELVEIAFEHYFLQKELKAIKACDTCHYQPCTDHDTL